MFSGWMFTTLQPIPRAELIARGKRDSFENAAKRVLVRMPLTELQVFTLTEDVLLIQIQVDGSLVDCFRHGNVDQFARREE